MAPTNALVLLALLAAILLFTRLARLGRWLAAVSAVGLLVCAASPLPYWLTRPLEDRFPRPDLQEPVAGIIVLGGAIDTVRGHTSLNEMGARMTDAAALAARFPQARIVFAGGDATLVEELDINEAATEAEAARRFFVALGIPESRLILEDKSRNTRENALFVKRMLDQRPGERWVLITSAWHMPRSVGLFRKVGVDVIPFPTDYTTRGTARDYSRVNRGFSFGLRLTDTIVKEWIGLVAYRLAGYTDEVLPGP